MISFGKKISMLRKEKNLNQGELATQLNTSVSVISRYERDEMLPSIEVAKKLAGLLDTTVGYLLGENEDNQLLKNPKILQRLQDIQKLSDNEQEHIFITLDALIRDFKNKKAYAS
jgi:transcriptional regulator with XRE-family HTH domain